MDPHEYEPPRQRKKPKVKESIIDHTYRDYSQVEVSSDDESADLDKKSSRLQPNFPAKLHAIVSNPNYQHIICWQPHGRSWKIVDKHLLSTVICPKHFAHAKFESFNRSVNGWGFKRLLNPGPDCKSYYHECFLRGRPELTKLMQRLVNPGKRLPDKAGEPDFYEISRKYPLPPLGSGSGGATQDQDAAPVASSPHHGQRPGQQQGGRFTFPPTQAGGYPYGYYPPQAGAYPQMPSPASGGYPAQPGYPPQPPQGAYWPQMPPMYAPMPGYYPYPQMMAPQGYDPQQAAAYGQHPMYGQPYPPGTPTGYPGPGSPERAKEAAAPGQPYPPPGPQGPYYPSPGARAAQPAGGEGEAIDDRKPAAQAGVKRPLEEDPHAGPGAPPQPEGSEGAPAAAAAAPAASAPEEGDQVKDAED